MDPTDEPVGDGGRIAARAKRIGPLAIVQLTEQRAGPADIFRCDPREELLVPAAVVKLHEAVRDAGYERFPIEDIRIAALRSQFASFAERGAEITNDVPAARGLSALHIIQRVVFVLEVRAVEHHQDDEQSLIRTHADERVLLPRPLAGVLERLVGQAEAAA